MILNATTRSGSSPISKYSPPPATAMSHQRRSVEDGPDDGRRPGTVGTRRLRNHAAGRRADADYVHRYALFPGLLQNNSHAAAPGLTVRNHHERFCVAALAEHLLIGIYEAQPPANALLYVRVPSGVVFEPEGRRPAEVVDEEEERVRILGKPHLRRCNLREERQRHAVALPTQRLGKGPEKLNRALPAVRPDIGHVHRRRRVLQDNDVLVGGADRGYASLRAREGTDA